MLVHYQTPFWLITQTDQHTWYKVRHPWDGEWKVGDTQSTQDNLHTRTRDTSFRDQPPPPKENSEIFEPMELSTQKSTSTDVDIYIHTIYLQTFLMLSSQPQSINTNEIVYLLPNEIGILLNN